MKLETESGVAANLVSTPIKKLHPPDVLLGGEEDDSTSLPSVQQEADDLVIVGGAGVGRDL